MTSNKRMTTLRKRVYFLLAVVGCVFLVGTWANGDSPPVTQAAPERATPTFFMAAVINGEEKSEGLAPLEMETRWQAQTLSDDPLRIRATLITRYKTEDNEGRLCARVKVGIGQDRVPLKGRIYQDCNGAAAARACKPFFVWSELDMCDDGMPPTANYAKYKAASEDKNWKPPVTEIKEPQP